MSVEATTSHSSLDRTSMGTCRTSRQRLCATVSLCTQRCAVSLPRTSRSVDCAAGQSARPTEQLGSNSSLCTRQPAGAVHNGASLRSNSCELRRFFQQCRKTSGLIRGVRIPVVRACNAPIRCRCS